MALGAALLAGCASQRPGISQDTPEAAAPEYIIGPGDTLSVFVYRAPELSAADVPVRPDGRVSLPLIPDIVAAGQTPTRLSAELQQRLNRYVLEPNVTVMVRSFRGSPNRQIRIIGEVTQPMVLPFREGLTVLDAMIEARGMTRFAAGNRAEIVRIGAEGRPQQHIPVRLADLLRSGDISQDVRLAPGDTLIVPASWF